MSTPSRAVIVPRVMGKWEFVFDRCNADRNGINAAAMISIDLIHLYFVWHLELFLSYQLIWSSRRAMIGSLVS